MIWDFAAPVTNAVLEGMFDCLIRDLCYKIKEKTVPATTTEPKALDLYQYVYARLRSHAIEGSHNPAMASENQSLESYH